MKRYIAFLDILGFSQIVKETELSDLINLVNIAYQNLHPASRLGVFDVDLKRQDQRLPLPTMPLVDTFSFSDTFVIASKGSTQSDFLYVLAATRVLSSWLFAQGLPVRGAVTFGEADYLPGTNHLVGKALVRAAELEKMQNWFGVLIDPDILDVEHTQALQMPFIAPVILEYDVPIKRQMEKSIYLPFVNYDLALRTRREVRLRTKVINWRLNLTIQAGTKAIFRKASKREEQDKINNTLKFCLHLRKINRVICYAHDQEGKTANIPWIIGCHVGELKPTDPRAIHGDEY